MIELEAVDLININLKKLNYDTFGDKNMIEIEFQEENFQCANIFLMPFSDILFKE